MEKLVTPTTSDSKYDSITENLNTVKIEATAKLEDALNSGNLKEFLDHVKENMKMLLDEPTLRSTLEYVFRQVLLSLLNKKIDLIMLERMFKYSIEAAVSGFSSGNLPVLILSDMLDGSTLNDCEKIFTFVENSAEVFKTDTFFRTCKNNLLRSCNDLLRKLSRTQNTVFCGRILLFLARIFPFSERSGLNIISEFNLDNTTKICASENDEMLLTTAEDEELDNVEFIKKPVIDYNLYRKFWCLQEYFRNPAQCYNKLQWRQFSTYSSEVLIIFGTFKADAIPPLHFPAGPSTSSDTEPKEVEYFAKFLTSPKLLERELCDSNFRRCVLIEFLILFQYLLSPVKFKLESYVLTEDQISWINDATTKIYKYLVETPPDGEVFCRTVKHLLRRESYWIKWKNEGCPAFKSPNEAVIIPKKKETKTRLGDLLLNHPGKYFLGNDELDRLWNICPDNWEACRSKKRKFVPTLEDYFENSIKQADPANKVPQEKKDINDSNFCWKGLLLLSKKSPTFFSVNNTPYKTTAEYLEATIQKIPKESSAEVDVSGSSEPLAREVYEDGCDEMLQTHDTDSSPKDDEPDTDEQDPIIVELKIDS